MAANIRPITPHLQSLQAPEPLRALQAWLIWRYEENPGGGKPRKVPYYASGGKRLGRQGAPTDVAQLVTFTAARKAAAARGFDGVGFATLEQFGITALDFDACVGENGVHPDVEALVVGTYAEFSPSGTGVRAFLRGSFGANPKSHATATQWGLEVFSTSGFVTFTGAALEVTEMTGCENVVAPITAAVRAEYEKRFGAVADAGQHNADTPPLGLTLDQVAEVLQALPNEARTYDECISVGMAVHHELGGDGFEVWDAWCAKSPKYTQEPYYEARWDSFGRNDSGKVVTFRTVLKLAREEGIEVPHGQVAAASDFEVIAGPARRDPSPLDLARLPAEPPEPRFIIPGWLPDGVVTLFSAHGGTGKSYMALYIAVCLAVGRHPFRPDVELDRVRVLVYSAEDDALVMQGRLVRYLRALQIKPESLAGWLDVLDATGCENVLFAEGGHGAGRITERFRWLQKRVQDTGARLLIFDNASDAMGANENDRAMVRQFMSSLKALASAVLLLSHVDAGSSMADPLTAKGYSGSTAWHNSARSRWFMARRPETEDIVLSLPKVNYARAGSAATIRWSDSDRVFLVADSRDGRARAEDHRPVLLSLLETAIGSGVRVSVARNTATSVWNVLKTMDGFPHGLTSALVAREVSRWQIDGLVEEISYMRENRTTGTHLALTEKGRRIAAAGNGEGIGDV